MKSVFLSSNQWSKIIKKLGLKKGFVLGFSPRTACLTLTFMEHLHFLFLFWVNGSKSWWDMVSWSQTLRILRVCYSSEYDKLPVLRRAFFQNLSHSLEKMIKKINKTCIMFWLLYFKKGYLGFCQELKAKGRLSLTISIVLFYSFIIASF